MKILAIADRKPDNSIKETFENNPIELICTLGDLDFFSLEDLKNINDIPKLGVYGNHCSGKYFESLGIKNMHMQTFEHNGLVFGGFEGSVKYKESETAKMYTQEEAAQMLSAFPKVDVLLTHCPPFGINDEPDDPTHAGFKAIREYIEINKPSYLLHGHTYPESQNMVTKHMDTEIIYVFKDKIIDLL